MTIPSIVLLVFFVIIAVLLVLLVLVQNEEGDNLGGIFAGGSGSAFGSRSGNILTRATSVLGALFLIVSLSLALLNRSKGGTGVESAGLELSGEASDTNWLEKELNPEGAENAGNAETAAPETLENAVPEALESAAGENESAVSE
jgi:preprotein translocase subunit SecG